MKNSSEKPTRSSVVEMGFITLGWLLMAVLIGFRYAEPVGDGDLFWQMAYGKYLLAHHTLIPNHTVYSFTPTDGTAIYCAWTAEIAYYLMYKAVNGLALLFAFRYLVVGGSICAAGYYGYRVGIGRNPLVWLLCVLLCLSAYVGTILKPELLSFLCFNALGALLYSFRWKAVQEEEKTAEKILIGIPLLIILWANTHGVFVFGIITVVMFTLGELLNYFVSPDLALSPNLLKKLCLTALLSMVAALITPYGYHYPVHLVMDFLGISSGKGHTNDYQTIAAYMPIWKTSAFHFMEYLAWMGICCVVMCVVRLFSVDTEGQRVDCSYVLVNLSLAFFYTWYLRSTFYWPPIFTYSTLYTMAQLDMFAELSFLYRNTVVSVLSICLGTFICVRGIDEAKYHPYSSSWCGFGITYWNPVYEAAFVAKFNPDINIIYNDYDSGGWLIWSLYPKVKVMMDPRYFPYQEYYSDYIKFERGEIGMEFLARFPQKADVAIISFKNSAMWRQFLHSKDWYPAFAGPSSIVFARRGKVSYPKGYENFEPDRMTTIRNSQKCLQIFQFYIEAGDYHDAWMILDVLKQNFPGPENQLLIDNLSAFKACIVATQQNKLDDAITAMEACRKYGMFFSNAILINLYKAKAQDLTVNQHKAANDPAILTLNMKMAKMQAGQDPTL
jgi:hypothetical protein